MPTSLSGRHFLRLLDFSTEEIEYLLKLSRDFKNLKRTGTPHRYLEGKNIVCCSRRRPPARAARSRLAPWTSAWA